MESQHDDFDFSEEFDWFDELERAADLDNKYSEVNTSVFTKIINFFKS